MLTHAALHKKELLSGELAASSLSSSSYPWAEWNKIMCLIILFHFSSGYSRQVSLIVPGQVPGTWQSATRGSASQILQPFTPNEMFALYICLSVLSSHPMKIISLDLPNLTYLFLWKPSKIQFIPILSLCLVRFQLCTPQEIEMYLL